jgi:threonylcarbamoyladenosine tRNA methylthiotransferase MtaB
MATVHAVFVGCKVSQADRDAALAELARAGHVPVARAADAEVCVVMSCCVTAEAERKSRQLARRLAAGGRPVLVTGCAAVYRPRQFGNGGVFTVPRGQMTAAVERLAERESSAAGGVAAADSQNGKQAPAAGAPVQRRTRLMLKVQDGCNGACTYCAVRLVRGPLWSLALADAVQAARAGLAAGCGEVVVSGVNLGLYNDGERDLGDLVVALTALPELARLRLSSIEAVHLTPRLLAALAHPHVARHLHVPLQSADDGVLAAMGRPYTFGAYRERMRAVRSALGDAMISTDVIIGHPAEDEAAFGRTMQAIDERDGLFGRVHVFAYSPRPGTAAAGLAPLPAAELKRRRLAALAAARATQAAAARGTLGRPLRVMVEDRVDGLWRGYSSEYTRCYLEGAAVPGRMVDAVASAEYRDGIRGTIAEPGGRRPLDWEMA